MIGVIIWVDTRLRQAMIWCEDQGDLAYFRWSDADDYTHLRKGDAVSFSIAVQGSLRLAEDLSLIEEAQSPTLSARLSPGQFVAGATMGPTAPTWPSDMNKRNRGTVMTWAEAQVDPLFIDMTVLGWTAVTLTENGGVQMPDCGPEPGITSNIIRFPDLAERKARAAAKRCSG
ncbi:hypothetical protein [Phaeobacter sp.]|uniref:hypothetical protein n=1 Tax=Phaeobacter sp. TaxID=1902409 RepID=UPI0025F00390|nr:hypothetical protein [Phaeobacter sp.]